MKARRCARVSEKVGVEHFSKASSQVLFSFPTPRARPFGALGTEPQQMSSHALARSYILASALLCPTIALALTPVASSASRRGAVKPTFAPVRPHAQRTGRPLLSADAALAGEGPPSQGAAVVPSIINLAKNIVGSGVLALAAGVAAISVYHSLPEISAAISRALLYPVLTRVTSTRRATGAPSARPSSSSLGSAASPLTPFRSSHGWATTLVQRRTLTRGARWCRSALRCSSPPRSPS